jgi:hypothetical protein
MSRLRLIVATAVALVLLLPATVLAASVEVSGTVTDKDGAAVAGAEVAILVQGTDMVFATTSDENGAWTIVLDVEADAAVVLEVNGTGPAVTTGPDDDGCTTTTTGSGQVTVELPVEGTPGPVALPLDDEISGTVCAATAKPDSPAKPDSDSPARPALTPPATDTTGAAVASSTGTGMLLLLGGLAAFIGLTAAFSARRR